MPLITPNLPEQIDSIIQEVARLRQRVDELAQLRSISASVATLAPRHLELVRDIPVVVTPTGDDFCRHVFLTLG